MTEAELRKRFPLGSKVVETKGNYGAPSTEVHRVVGYHRGAVVLEEPRYGTTHHVKGENVRRVGGGETRRDRLRARREFERDARSPGGHMTNPHGR